MYANISTPSSKSSHPSPCGVYEKCCVAACQGPFWSLILQVGSTHLSEMALWSAAQMSFTPSNFPETWQVPSKEPKACYKGAALTLSEVTRQK